MTYEVWQISPKPKEQAGKRIDEKVVLEATGKKGASQGEVHRIELEPDSQHVKGVVLEGMVRVPASSFNSGIYRKGDDVHLYGLDRFRLHNTIYEIRCA